MRTVLSRRSLLGLLAVAALGATGCADDRTASGDGSARVVVSTSLLGDVVANLVGDDVEVEVLMPPNADPHDFAPSAKQAAALRDADVVIVNGLGFEEGLLDTIGAAEDDGATVIAATDFIDPLPFDGDHDHAHDDHAGDEDAASAGEADDEHEADPHLFTDPARMAVAARGIGGALAERIEALDTPAAQERIDAYVVTLEQLDAEVETILDAVPLERRVLVTNHDVFGYFADRYGFEVLGSVIPGGGTLAEPSAADLADLADAIADAGVPAIFAETSAPTRLAEALAAEGTDVEVVELYSESLGEPGSDGATYVEMVRTNARRVAAALAPRP